MLRKVFIQVVLVVTGLLTSMSLFAQLPTQTIKGKVIDKTTRHVLIGANVQAISENEVINTITDINGEFIIDNFPLGRTRIKCSFLGYESYVTPTFVVHSAKVPNLEIALKESSFHLDEVVSRAIPIDKKAQNEMVVLSGRSFSQDETERYAGSIADPSRMVVSFAGVQATNDLDNDIVVRGNSSVGVLWRLEGIDIPNPNHFARRGSSGGAIGIFSVNMINNSDFIFGSPPAEYGNTLSSVFDMKFRKGNTENNEFAFRAGLLGLDLVAEGPIREGRSSFLVNYRYSTLGLLNKLNIYLINDQTDVSFSDLAFHLYLPSENRNNIFQVWGVGGFSSEIHRPLENPNDWEQFDNLTHTDFRTKMGVMGLSYTHLIDDNSYIKAKLALMGDDIIHNKDTVNQELHKGLLLRETYKNARVTNAFEYVRKISSDFKVKAGIQIHWLGYDLQYSEYERNKREHFEYINEMASIGENQLTQSFVEGSLGLGKHLTLNGGIHLLNFSLNGTKSLEPRLSFNYRFANESAFALALGAHSQVVPIGSYFSHEDNMDLKLMKSRQVIASYTSYFNENFKFSLEGYMQILSGIPVARDSSVHYWMLNDLVGYSKFELQSEGKGRNIGVDATLERFFENRFFFLATLSVYSSKYSLDGEDYFETLS